MKEEEEEVVGARAEQTNQYCSELGVQEPLSCCTSLPARGPGSE